MDIDLLLLGKTGMGKSATGNAILGRKAFKSKADMTSVTVLSKKDVAELDDGRRIHVIDTPGVADTGCTEEEGKNMFLTALREAIAMSPQGYHALLLTLRFGSRLTKEDVDVLRYLREVLGANFIQKYCIVIITYGDNFKNDDEIEGSFADWCKNQTGSFKDLFDEVNGRVILFDNRGSVDVKAEQRQELVTMVDKLTLGGRRYTNAKFEKARKELEKIMRDKRLGVLSNEIKDETSLILAELGNINGSKSFADIDAKIGAFTKLMVRIDQQVERIQAEDMTDLMLKVKSIVNDARMKVQQEINFLSLNKELEQKKKSDADAAAQRIRELEEQVKSYERAQKDTRKDLDKLVDNFQEVRDKNNGGIVQSIFDTLTWPVKSIYGWFTGGD